MDSFKFFRLLLSFRRQEKSRSSFFSFCFSFFADGLHPSLIYCALSGLRRSLFFFLFLFLFLRRWAAPIADILRPFRAKRIFSPLSALSLSALFRLSTLYPSVPELVEGPLSRFIFRSRLSIPRPYSFLPHL